MEKEDQRSKVLTFLSLKKEHKENWDNKNYSLQQFTAVELTWEIQQLFKANTLCVFLLIHEVSLLLFKSMQNEGFNFS